MGLGFRVISYRVELRETEHVLKGKFGFKDQT